jgi:hypothetical protein
VTSNERKVLEKKILEGARIAALRLLEKELKNGGHLHVVVNGKAASLPAHNIKLK